MNTKDFIEKPVNKLFFHYLIPAICATMVTSIYVLADTIIIGKGIGATAVAALNIALPVYNVFFGFGLLFGVGGSVLMSIYRGSGNEKKANGFFSTALVLNIAVWVLATIICSIFAEDIAWALGATDETIGYIMDYIPWIIGGTGAFLFSSFLQTFIRNDGAPKLAMKGVIAGGVTNIILDYVFVYPLQMGMQGAALATVIGSMLTVLILLTHFLSSKNQLRFSLKSVRIVYVRDIFVNGFTSFIIEAASGFTIFVFNMQLLKYFGNTGVTVYGIICNTAIIVTCLCKGIEQAAQPILSINYGAGLSKRLLEIQSLSVKASVIVCGIFVLLGLLVPNLFTYIFIHPDAAILEMSGKAIRIYFSGFIFLGINMVFICYFQSVAKAVSSLVLCLLRGGILITVFVCVLPICIGSSGIWFAFLAAEFTTMVIGIIIYNKEMKRIRELR